MDAAQLGPLYSQLPDLSTRRDALDSLVSSLDKYDWMYLRDKLVMRPFQSDIVAGLPVELVIPIFEHLGPMDAYRLRCVSKPWNHKLKSTALEKKVLAKWYDVASIDEAHLARRAEQIYRLQHGNPSVSSSVSVDLDFGACHLANDTITWAERGPSRAVHLLTLSTGEHWQACGASRELIRLVAVSDRLVAFSTMSNICYAIDLTTRERKSFTLPGYMQEQLTCRGSIVACASEKEIYLWDYDVQKGRSLQLPFEGQFSNFTLKFLSLPALGGTGVTIFYTVKGKNDTEIHGELFGTSGSIRKTSQLIPLVGVQLRHLRPVDRKGKFALIAQAKFPSSTEIVNVSLEFDDQDFTFRVPRSPSGSELIPHGLVWWKDSYYQIRDLRGVPSGVVPVCLGTREQPMDKPLLKDASTQDSRELNCYWRAFVNDTALVLFYRGRHQPSPTGFTLYCFDKSISLPADALQAGMAI